MIDEVVAGADQRFQLIDAPTLIPVIKRRHAPIRGKAGGGVSVGRAADLQFIHTVSAPGERIGVEQFPQEQGPFDVCGIGRVQIVVHFGDEGSNLGIRIVAIAADGEFRDQVGLVHFPPIAVAVGIPVAIQTGVVDIRRYVGIGVTARGGVKAAVGDELGIAGQKYVTQ